MKNYDLNICYCRKMCGKSTYFLELLNYWIIFAAEKVTL